MASLDLRALRTILADAIGEIKNLKEGNKDLASGIADLEKKYQSNTTALEKTVKATEKLANEGLNTTRVLKEQKTEIGEYSKRASEAEKSIAKLTRTVASLKEKLAESNAKIKQQSKEMGASFKDMATMLNEAFYGKGTKKQPNLANFFKKEFATLATSITSEIKNIKMNTTNIGLDIGDGLLKGLSEGVKKGKGSSAGNGISQAMQNVIDAEINKVKDGLKARLAKIASDVGLTTTEGLRDAMKAISESRKDTKDLMAYKDLQVFGSPEAKAQMKQNFAGVIQELVKHQKDIEKYSEKHGQNLTKIEQDRINKIRDLVKSAKAVASSGMAGNDPGGSLDIIRAFAKQANEIKVAQKKSLDGNKQLVDAYVSGEKVKMDAAIRADKIDEMLLQQKMQRQNKLTKSIITTTKQQEAEINKLTTGRTNTKESAGLGKVSSFVVKTDEEKTVLKSINFIKERMLDLKNNESMNLQDRIRLHKSYSAQFQQMTKHLVDQISERKKSENDYINWWKTEGAAGLDARVKKEKEVNDMWQKLLGDKEKETIKAEKKAQAERLKASTEFAEQQLKQEQSLQERLRRLTGKFTEQEKYTKSKKYLDLSINNQVKAEVDQANRIQTLIQGYQRAKTKAGAATTDGDRIKWEDQTKALMAAAERETNVLKEMVYRRLNADRESGISKKKAAREAAKLLKDAQKAEKDKLKSEEDIKNKSDRLKKEETKQVQENLKQQKKLRDDANAAVIASANKVSQALGLGWRNRNVMESLQQFGHSFRRFGHDLGMMAETAAKNIMYLTATITGMAGAVGVALAVAAKKMYNFGAEIIKTTEEVRGYQIALYGMMGTQSGVNEMLEVAEKVTKTMPIGFKTIQESVKGMVLIGPVRDMLRNTKDVEGVMGSLFKIVVGLSQIQPEWGAKGAIFSLRNALTGDLRSLQRRFELPVRAIYSAEGIPLQDLQYQPEKMVETLDTYISSFYSAETLKMSSNQFSAIMEKMAGNWIKFVKTIGESGFYDLVTKELAKVRDLFQNFVDSEDFKVVTKDISNGFANIFTSIKNVAMYIGGNIAKVFGINDISDVTSIGDAFKLLAKSVKIFEKTITSGKLGSFLIAGGSAIYKALVEPVMEFKDLVVEMGKDAISVFNKIANSMSKVFSGTSEGVGKFLSKDTLKKGILWTLFFGPANVMMLVSSIGLLFSSVVGVVVNTMRAILGMISLIKNAWMLAWALPFMKIPLLLATAVIAVKSGLIVPVSKALFTTFTEVFKWLRDQFALIWQDMRENIPLLKMLFPDTGVKVFKSEADKQAQIDSQYAKFDIKQHAEATLEPQGRFQSFKNELLQSDAVQASARGLKDYVVPMIGGPATGKMGKAGLNAVYEYVGINKAGEFKRFEETIKNLSDSKVAYSWEEAQKNIIDSSADLGNGLNDLFKDVTSIDTKEAYKKAIDAIDSFTNATNYSSEQINYERARLQSGFIATGMTPDLNNLQPDAIMNASKVIGALSSIGLDAKITSAFRGDDLDSTHSKGIAIDFQAGDWKGKTGDEIIMALKPLLDAGILSRLGVENSKTGGIFNKESDLIKENAKIFYDIGDLKDGNSLIHAEFSNNIKDAYGLFANIFGEASDGALSLNDIADRFNKEMAAMSLENYDSDTFVNVNEQGAELLKSISNLDSSMGSITMGIRQHVSKMTDMVNATFNDLKDDEGHMFGPEAITKLQSSYEAEIAKRRRIYDKVSQQYRKDNPLYAEGAIPDSILSPLVAQQAYSDMYVKTAPRTFGKIAAGMGGGLSSPTGMGMAVQGMVAMAVQISKEADFVDRVVNRFDEFNKEFADTMQLARKFSAEYLSDAMFNKTFEYATVPMDRLQETFGRNFDLKAMEEALSMTYGLHSNFAATEEEAQQLMKDMVGLTKEGYSYEDAVKKVLSDFANSPEATAEMKQSAEAMSKTFLEYFNNIKESNKELTIQKNIYATMVGNLKKMNIEQLKAAKGQYLGSKSTSVRKGYAAEYRSRIEEGIETDSFDNIFAIGMESAVAEWDNFGTMVLSGAGEVANGMRQAFEDGFFGFMTGEFKNLADMFRNIGKSILQTISKILAQIAAVSVTKMILGIDVQGGLTSGSSGGLGGLGGIIGSLTGGQGGIGNFIGDLLYGKSKSSGVDLSSVAMNLGGGSSTITGQLLSKAASFIPGANIIDSVIKGGTASKASGGLLSKLGIGKITPLSALGLTAAATFLSQPGRLFGGRIDKTGDAQEKLAEYNSKRAASVGRRGSDAIGYYMGSGTSAIQDYEFGGVDYRTWKSGGGFLGWKGPKEKHAAADPSSYLASLKNYYNLLMNAGQEHYGNMKGIHKLAETNELASIKRQYEFDKTKLRMTQRAYDTYASDSYTEADKYEKMDEYRDKVLDQEFANWEMREQIAKLEKETYYKQMEYDVFKLTSGTDSIAMAKVALEIEKDRHKQYTQGTIEWYDSKMALMNSESELAQTLRSVAKQTQENLNNVMKQIYEIGDAGNSSISRTTTGAMMGIYDKYAEKDAFESGKYTQAQLAYRATLGYKPTGEYSPKKLVYSGTSSSGLTDYDPILAKYQKDNPNNRYTVETQRSLANNVQASTLRFGVPAWRDTFNIYEETALMEKQWNLSIDEIVENIDEEIQDYLENYALDIKKMELRRDIGRSIYQLDTAVDYQYERLLERKTDLEQIDYINQSLIKQGKKPLMDSAELNITKKEFEVAVVEFYASLGDQIANVINSGYIDEDSTGIRSFVTAIYGGLNDLAVSVYEDIMMTGRKMATKSSMLGTIRDMEDFSIYNQVMATDEMAGLKGMMGSNINMSGYSDPYSAWFDFNKSVIQTRIGNAEEGSEEWFAAQNDLFNLMIENAEKLKEKAENMTRSIEDMLGKIEETMRMRIAEERQTAKGDVYFVDVGSTRNSQQMLDRMLAAVKTNDPEAMKLIEEFKKKMLGIGR